MPRFLVKEKRAYELEFLIDAVDERAARYGDGEIVEEAGGDYNSTYSDDIISVEQVDDEAQL